MKKTTTSKWIYIALGAILMVVLSFTLLYKLLIPDVCYYHTHEMNSFMSLFYSAGPADNGHPSPNFTNFLVSFVLGGIIGYGTYNLINKIHLIKN
jgi:hypothetical protein